MIQKENGMRLRRRIISWKRFWWDDFFRHKAVEWKIWTAGKLPHWLVYWAAIRVATYATTGEYSNQIVPELHFTEGLERWHNQYGE